MSYNNDLERALNAARNASYSAKKSAAKSPNSFLQFLRDLGLRTLANSLSDWIKNNWTEIAGFIIEHLML